MYRPAPRTPERVSLNLPNPTSEQKEYLETREKWRHRALRTLAGVSVALSTVALPYADDVHLNEAKEAYVEVQVDQILDHQSDATTIFSDGFNTTDAHFLAEKIGPAVQQVNEGSVASLNPGDAPPDFDKMANQVIEYANAHKRTHMSLFGYSMGGIEVLNVAERILANSNLQIDTIYLASTPDSFDSILTFNKDQFETLTKVAAALPYSEHSSITKFIMNAAFSGGDLSQAWQATQSDERPSVATAEDQINLVKSNVEATIQRIGQTQDKIIPKIVYLKIKNPSDNIVNEDRADAQFKKYAKEAHVLFTTLTVEGTQHAEYYTDQSVAGYTKTIALGKPELDSLQAQQEKAFALEQWKNHFQYTADALDPATIKLLQGMKQ